ncbi:hypothetical protein Vau01_106630 [Virgisporangium aurantiacum]|uniref:Uncharacterized protein n=1 Tax=Virgisporangium aurantiacum TaxID=175570 RepID=A0A8J4E8V8_9ACTN|nr:hypothetical protein Vau01_106630 [Virgisporangium aurantiacum]
MTLHLAGPASRRRVGAEPFAPGYPHVVTGPPRLIAPGGAAGREPAAEERNPLTQWVPMTFSWVLWGQSAFSCCSRGATAAHV